MMTLLSPLVDAVEISKPDSIPDLFSRKLLCGADTTQGFFFGSYCSSGTVGENTLQSSSLAEKLRFDPSGTTPSCVRRGRRSTWPDKTSSLTKAGCTIEGDLNFCLLKQGGGGGGEGFF
jgi:hypothetical protein